MDRLAGVLFQVQSLDPDLDGEFLDLLAITACTSLFGRGRMHSLGIWRGTLNPFSLFRWLFLEVFWRMWLMTF